LANIWALDKDIAIKHLLLMLDEHFADGGFRMGDSTELPASAVRLYSPDNPGLSVYLYTHGQNHGRYGIHLEYPRLGESPVSDTVEMLEDVRFDRLVELLAMHFEIP